ncbi:secreted frizzled-related protein 2-like isoform X2 [Acanthochromis polyacanthus]|uniref:secreted frizzled-related protein 2-like isoform X2 n=1 Tax=Acanthochromis polyacanthus TaxID=80966 RepID=UPI00223416AE|nr:secreted frizzled-related protein 2-like isoform X2 [Acanthochromis polyacanthus]
MSASLLTFVLLFTLSRASDTVPPAQLGPPSLGFSSSVRSVCKPIPSTLSLCHGIGYRRMWIPNLLGHDSLREAQQQSAAWLPLISKLCHRDTKKFLCSLFAPVCLPELSGPLSPCRSLCEAVRDGCVPVMSAFGFPWPQMFNCSRFPRGTELCIPATGEQEGRTTEEVRHEEALKAPEGTCPYGEATMKDTHPDDNFIEFYFEIGLKYTDIQAVRCAKSLPCRPAILIMLSALDDEVQLPGALVCSLLVPSCSSSTLSSSLQTKSRKGNQEAAVDPLQYLERSEERFFEQIGRHQDVTSAMLQNIQKMNENLGCTDGTHGVGAGATVPELNCIVDYWLF